MQCVDTWSDQMRHTADQTKQTKRQREKVTQDDEGGGMVERHRDKGRERELPRIPLYRHRSIDMFDLPAVT